MEYYFKFYILSGISIKCGEILPEVFLFNEAIYLALLLRLHTHLLTRTLL